MGGWCRRAAAVAGRPCTCWATTMPGCARRLLAWLALRVQPPNPGVLSLEAKSRASQGTQLWRGKVVQSGGKDDHRGLRGRKRFSAGWCTRAEARLLAPVALCLAEGNRTKLVLYTCHEAEVVHVHVRRGVLGGGDDCCGVQGQCVQCLINCLLAARVLQTLCRAYNR